MIDWKAALDVLDNSAYWDKMHQSLNDAGIDVQRRIVNAGGQYAIDAGVVVDLDQVHAEAAHIARTTISPMMGKVVETTRTAARLAIVNWVESGLGKRGLPDLIKGLAPLFDGERASIIAVTEATRIFSEANQMAADQDENTGGMEWHAAEDELMCPTCKGYHGKIYPKSGGPRPPAHTRCRCAVIPVSWRYIKQNIGKWQGGPLPANIAIDPEDEQAVANAVQQETEFGPPEPPFDIAELKAQPTNLKGAHAKTIYTDKQGDKWLFKPESTSGVAELAAYRLNHLAGLEAPETYFVTLEGKLGSIQRMWPDIAGEVPVTGHRSLSQQQREDIQQHHVMDWLTSQHDTNDGALLLTAGGRVRSVDKGQAWKFLGKDKLGWHYSPNPNTLVYEDFFEQAANGQYQLTRASVEDRIRAVEGISDDLFKQIVQPVVDATVLRDARYKPDKLMEAMLARKHGLRADFDKFYSDLEAERLRRNPVAPVAVTNSVTKLDDTFVKDIKRVGWAGKSVMVGGGMVEDGAVLAYELRHEATGSRALILDMKLRAPGEAMLLQSIGGVTAPAVAATADEAYNDVLPAIKHFNFHMKGDKAITDMKLAPIINLAFEVAPSGMGYGGLMSTSAKLHWADKVEELTGYKPAAILQWTPAKLSAEMKAKWPNGVPQLDPYTPKAATPKRTVTANTLSAQRVKPTQLDRRLENGELVTGGGQANLLQTDTGYEIDLGDGYTAMYVQHGDSNCYSKMGRLQITKKGWNGDPDEIEAGLAKLKMLGVESELATRDDMELLAFHKQADAMKLENDQAYQRQLAKIKPGMTVAEQLKVMREYWEARFRQNPDVLARMKPGATELQPKFQPVWNPATQLKGELEGHKPHWERFDMTDDDVRNGMPDMGLTHSFSGGDSVDFFERALKSNMYLAPTEERARAGIQGAHGMSESSDMGTGGADYFFTRIKATANQKSYGNIVLDVALLRRCSTITYDRDTYGASDPGHKAGREVDIASWKDCARRTSDETCIKNGFPILPYLQKVFVRSAAEKKRLIEMFTKAGITKVGGKTLAQLISVK